MGWKAILWDAAKILARTTVKSSGCWEAKKIDKDGYPGQVSVNGRLTKLHRLAYTFFRGDFDKSLNLDHLCKNKRCVNPWHLEPVTIHENIRRRILVPTTHCTRGHEFTPENTLSRKGGAWRCCRACNTQRFRDRRKRIKAGVESYGISSAKGVRPRKVKKGPRRRKVWDLAAIKAASRVNVNGCWEWRYLTRKGWPATSGAFIQGAYIAPHRFTYMLVHGPDSLKGLHADHLCRNRACCNPEHLEGVTAAVNNSRRPVKPQTSHCRHGHEYTEENSYFYPDKSGKSVRHCRKCRTAANGRRKAFA